MKNATPFGYINTSPLGHKSFKSGLPTVQSSRSSSDWNRKHLLIMKASLMQRNYTPYFLYLNVNIYIRYIHTHTCNDTHVCGNVYLCTYMYTYAHASLPMYVSTYMHMYIHMYVCMHACNMCMYIQTYIHVSLHTYIHTYMLKYIHWYMHTHTDICLPIYIHTCIHSRSIHTYLYIHVTVTLL